MQCYLEFLLDIWPSTIWPMRIVVLITTAEAFDNILFVLLHGARKSILLCMCIHQ